MVMSKRLQAVVNLMFRSGPALNTVATALTLACALLCARLAEWQQRFSLHDHWLLLSIVTTLKAYAALRQLSLEPALCLCAMVHCILTCSVFRSVDCYGGLSTGHCALDDWSTLKR
eukprot:6204195-Pleurochrysis_carterae.AAC.4